VGAVLVIPKENQEISTLSRTSGHKATQNKGKGKVGYPVDREE
jgi:hypothetical protein